MAITVTRDRVKEKCGISGSSYDTAIDNLLADHVPVIEHSIRDSHLADAGVGIVATLDLAATEIVSGETMAMLLREPGALETVRVGELTIEPSAFKDLVDPSGLVKAGWARLAPYLKDDPAVAVTVSVSGDYHRGGGS